MTTRNEPASDRDDRRQTLDTAQTRRRADADGERAEKRELVDLTRQNQRGDRQAREGLDRERARDDENLRVERDQADEARAAERRHGDAALAREKEARAEADHALAQRLDREVRRDRALREALALVQTQILVVTGSLTELLEGVPPGSAGGRLREGIETIRVASARMQRLLADALDPGDGRQLYHDVGGSG